MKFVAPKYNTKEINTGGHNNEKGKFKFKWMGTESLPFNRSQDFD